MKIQSLTFITGNKAKAEQLARHFNMPFDHKKVDLNEIQSLSLEEIIEHKAREAYKIVSTPVLVEDASLVFHALGRLPGPLIKWFLTELDNEGLCRILDRHKDRSATAEVMFGLYDGKEFYSFRGEMKGSIVVSPRGEQGFGWDPVFQPSGWDKTWAEMNPNEQKETSMRRMALKKLETFLETKKL